MPKLFYFLLPLSIVRHVFEINKPFDESESVLLRFLRKLESVNENFPDGGFVGLLIGIDSLVYGTSAARTGIESFKSLANSDLTIDIEPKAYRDSMIVK